MEIFDYHRFYFLLEMAMHFSSKDWTNTLGKFGALSTERKCLVQIYEHMKLGESVNAEMDESHCCLIPFKEIAQSPFSYPYLESIMDCQQELWRLFLYYRDVAKDRQPADSGIKERQQLIIQLLLIRKWSHDDIIMARNLVEWATLRHFYFPVVHYAIGSDRQTLDLPPF